jgi:hypothetical protein
MLPALLEDPLHEHLRRVRDVHEADRRDGVAGVPLPHALARKYPNASSEWVWQYVFPSATLSPDRDTGELRRFHASPRTVQRAVKTAVREARNLSTRMRESRRSINEFPPPSWAG